MTTIPNRSKYSKQAVKDIPNCSKYSKHAELPGGLVLAVDALNGWFIRTMLLTGDWFVKRAVRKQVKEEYRNLVDLDFLLDRMHTKQKIQLVKDLWLYHDSKADADAFAKSNTLPELKPCIVVTGLPRTGTTLLQRLLTMDPDAHYLDSRHVFCGPLAKVDGPTFDKIVTAYNLDASHPMRDGMADEELPLTERTNFPMPLRLFSGILPKDELWKELPYVTKELRVHQALQPDSLTHWVLKTPVHSLYVDKLVAALGGRKNVTVVTLTRDLEKVVPSTARLFESWSKTYLDVDRWGKAEIGAFVAEFLSAWSAGIERCKDSFDCHFTYEQLMQDPIDTVEQIYKASGKKVSQAFRQRMQEWLDANPQGKYGRAPYSLEEYGYKKQGNSIVCTKSGVAVTNPF